MLRLNIFCKRFLQWIAIIILEVLGQEKGWDFVFITSE